MQLRSNAVWWGVAAGVLAALTPSVASSQHITIDGKLSPAQILTGPGYTIGANLGKQVGGNLFQSFGLFGLTTGESANFTGPSTVANIIGRVTGGSLSSINGTIQSSIPKANLYLINPSGIVFGPNATVNVTGSFHASTADYLKMSDGAKFQATNPSGSTLSAAAPAAFGFLNPAPPAIMVNGSSLSVPTGQTLGLVGGPVSIAGAHLNAPGGTIHVTGVASTGEVPVDPNVGPSTIAVHGAVSIGGGSLLQVSDPAGGGSGGSLFVHAGTLTLDGSELDADNYGMGSGGTLLLSAANQLSILDMSNVHAIARGSGNGADLVLRTGRTGIVTVDNSFVGIGSLGSGNAGRLSVTGGNLAVQDFGVIESDAVGAGNGGAIVISLGGALTLSGSSLIASNASGAGIGGAISISADAVTLDGSLDQDTPTAIASLTSGPAKGGDTTITAATSLSVLNGAQITGTTSGFDTGGPGGAITASAPTITLDGGEFALPSGIFSSTGVPGSTQIVLSGSQPNGAPNPVTTGNGGPIMVSATTLTIANGASISSSATGNGAGGVITISATNLTLDGGAIGSTATGIFATAGPTDFEQELFPDPPPPDAIFTPTATGPGGAIGIAATSVQIQNGATITSQTSDNGNSGPISITASGLALNGGTILSQGGPSGLLGELLSMGQGGSGSIRVTITGTDLTLNASTISANTVGFGAGGDVTIVAPNAQLSMAGSSISTQAGLSNLGLFDDVIQTGSAPSGSIAVNTRSANLTASGIFTSTTGFGNGGGTTITTNALVLDRSRISTFAGSDADSFVAATGKGTSGPVLITAATLTLQNGSVVSSETESGGAGGTVTVNVGGALTLNASEIASSTQSSGASGAIDIAAGSIVIAGATDPPGQCSPFCPSPAGIIAQNGNQIDATGPGLAGPISVKSKGDLTMTGLAEIGSQNIGPGPGGDVTVMVAGKLSIDAGNVLQGNFLEPFQITMDPFVGIRAVEKLFGSGANGAVTVRADEIDLNNGAAIGAGLVLEEEPLPTGDVTVMARGLMSLANNSYIASDSSLFGGSTPAGRITIHVGALQMTGDSTITASTISSGGMGGSIDLTVDGPMSLDNSAILAESNFASGNAGSMSIVSGAVQLTRGSLVATDTFGALTAGTTSSNGGSLVLISAGPVALSGGSQLSSSTQGLRNGGSVRVTAGGPLTLSGQGTAIVASASSLPGGVDPSSGNAGSVTIAAPQIAISDGAQLSTSAAATGAGGPLTITAGDIMLVGPGPQISAVSTGSGDAGSITVTANNLSLTGGASISTDAASANGGNITLHVARLLYLLDSGITTAVDGARGNGGNITIDPQFVVLNGGDIIANAIGGNGGNILVDAGRFLESSDSTISATSELGLPGAVDIEGIQTALDKSLVVLSSDLRGNSQLGRDKCAAAARSTLVDVGRGGLPQDTEATIPALYLAGRGFAVAPRPHAAAQRGGNLLVSSIAIAIGCR